MRCYPLAMLVYFLFSGVALAGDSQPVPTPAPVEPLPVSNLEAPARVSLLIRPSLKPVFEALIASGIENIEAILEIEYDVDGVVINSAMHRSSGNAAVDQAITGWGKAARVTPGAAGKGKIPFSLLASDQN